VARGVNDQETGDLELKPIVLVNDGRLRFDGLNREVRSTNLLGNTSSFALLNVGLSDLVKKLRLSSIDVSQNTADGRAQIVRGSSSQGGLVGLFSPLRSFLLALSFGLLGL
jgi:hypothetical protein